MRHIELDIVERRVILIRYRDGCTIEDQQLLSNQILLFLDTCSNRIVLCYDLRFVTRIASPAFVQLIIDLTKEIGSRAERAVQIVASSALKKLQTARVSRESSQDHARRAVAGPEDAIDYLQDILTLAQLEQVRAFLSQPTPNPSS